MPSRFTPILAAATLWAAIVSSSAFAQDAEKPAEPKKNDRGPVHLEPPADDPNYRLMGEFVGPITIAENQYQTIGLQIRPLGENRFEAISYNGGLPGQKDHQGTPTRLIGMLANDLLVLSGAPWAVLAHADHCLIIGRGGEKLGRLERIARRSPTLNAKPPAEAIVLFDGSGVDQFLDGKLSPDMLLIEGATIKPMFQDFDMHLEYRLPYMPGARDQGRGNSGVYLQSRYECQILDSFGDLPVFNGAGSLYRFRAPDLNMSLPPLTWQTYDIRFTAPRWGADGKKIRNARITTWLNGTIVQNDVELLDKTGAGQIEEPNLLPIKLQNHSDPVRFRNIWIIDRGLAQPTPFPVEGNGEVAPPAPAPAPADAKPAEAKPADAKPADATPSQPNPEPAKS